MSYFFVTINKLTVLRQFRRTQQGFDRNHLLVAPRKLPASLVVTLVVFRKRRQGEITAVLQLLRILALVNVQLVLAVLNRGAIFVHETDERESEEFLVVLLPSYSQK